MIRSAQSKDLEEIRKLADFPLPKGKEILSHIVSEINGKISYGVVEHFGEVMIVLNPELGKKSKVKAMKEMLVELEEFCASSGIKQVYVFIKNNSGFSDILQRHFGFKKPAGEVLFLEVGNG